MNFIALFFAGAFLCNGIPHLSSGLKGQPFPSPFAKPMGIGDSSPTINFLWGLFNIVVGMLLLSRHGVFVGFNGEFGALLAGVLVSGLQLANHFGKVQRSRSAK
jgi:hypothetical protein